MYVLKLRRTRIAILWALLVAAGAWNLPLAAHHCKGDHAKDCSPSGGGGGDGGGEQISLECQLPAQWGTGSSSSFQGDALGLYKDGEDKVGCGVNGPSTPWPLRLWPVSKGNPDRAPRRIDIVLDEDSFEDGTGQGTGRDYIPDMLFNAAAADPDNTEYPALDDTEIPQIQVRPYRDTQNPDGIHLLDPGESGALHGMAFKVRVLDEQNVVYHISLASRHIAGNEKFSGISCQSGDELKILAGVPGGMQDISVFLWPDSNGNGLADDGYTVTTGTVVLDPPPATMPPPVTGGSRVGAICSYAGPIACENGEFCNFLGYVDLDVTFHAWPKP